MTPPPDYAQLSQEELQQRYHSGDGEALLELRRRHLATQQRWAANWTWPDEHWAEDALQDLYVRATRPDVQEGYDPARPWLTWTLQILRNLIEDQRDRRRVRASESLPEGGLPGGSPSPEEEAAFHEFEQVLETCIQELSEAQRATLQLARQGQDLQAIADATGVAYGTAGSRLSRARKLLADCLARHGYEVTIQ